MRQETLKGESDLFEHRKRLGDVSLEEEISRLESELASSRRLQDALERYLVALSDRDTAR